MSKEKPESASAYMEREFGKLTIGRYLRAIRLGEEWSLAEMGKKLGVSGPHLSDIEHERRTVSPERASAWAGILGYSQAQFVRLAVQSMLDEAGLKLSVSIKEAKGPRRAAVRTRP